MRCGNYPKFVFDSKNVYSDKSIQSDKISDWPTLEFRLLDLTPIFSDLFELLHVNVAVVVPVEYLERIPEV